MLISPTQYNDGLPAYLFGATGDGVTDDGPAIRRALAFADAYGLGVVTLSAGKVYLCGKAGNKNFVYGGAPTSAPYTFSIPSGVIIEGNGATLKVKNEDSVFISNENSASITDTNLGMKNVVIDGNGFSMTAGSGSYFYGVDNLVLENCTFTNGSRFACAIEKCTNINIDNFYCYSWVGQGLGTGIYSGVTSGNVKSVICHNITTKVDEPNNFPGNPFTIGGNPISIGSIYSDTCDAGIKFSRAKNVTVSSIICKNGTTLNSGVKIQGDDASNICENISIGNIVCTDNYGTGLRITFSKNCQIGSYYGENNSKTPSASGSEGDILICGYTQIGSAKSVNSGLTGLNSKSGSSFQTDYFEFCIDDLQIENCHSNSTAANPTALFIQAGFARLNKVKIIDNKSTATISRYIDTSRNLGSKVTIEEFYARAAISPYWNITATNSYIKRPDVAQIVFPNGTLTLSAVTGTITATSSVAIFVATDVGSAIYTSDGGLLQIDTFTSSTVVSCAVTNYSPTSTSNAANSWYIDRGKNMGVVSLTAAATSTSVLNECIRNSSATYGAPRITFIPLNSGARTLGQPNYTLANGSFNLLTSAAAGGEAYSYYIDSFQTCATAIS